MLKATLKVRLCLLILLVGYGFGVNADQADCEPANGFTPLCGFLHPEDIEVIDGGAWLLISEYGNLVGSEAGRLSAYVPEKQVKRVLFPSDTGVGEADWGASDCPGPPGAEISPHGIHHGPTGGNRVLVVNHAGREAVEIFELDGANDPAAARLIWRGCVPAPDGTWMNDVVALPDGGFIVTHMVAPGTPEKELHAAEHDRRNTGYLLRWSVSEGWKQLPNSAGAVPNGVEIADDAKTVYVNEYFGDRAYALDLVSGKRVWSVAVDAPDNFGWGSDGALLIASHHENLDAINACNQTPKQYCSMRYSIVAVDPESGYRQTVVEGGDKPFGAATVAVEVGQAMYLGSFVGDRMAVTQRGTGMAPAAR